MAIIRIPDDDVIEKLVTRRSFLRDVGPINGTWVDEPIIGEITQRTKPNRKLQFLNGTTSLKDIAKLTIIGHGSSHGFLIGPNAVTDSSSPPAPIYAEEMAHMLTAAGYSGGYSIDVMGCFSDYFAKNLSTYLPGIYVKGYTDPITIESSEALPIYYKGGSVPGKAVIVPHERGAPVGEKGKNRYLNGVAVESAAYKASKAAKKLA